MALQTQTIRIFCHRGFFGVTDIGTQDDADAKGDALKSYPPENSEESIEKAFKNGFSVEIDVTMTAKKKDEQDEQDEQDEHREHIIVTHTNDLTVHSKDAKPGDYVSEKTFKEIQKMRTGLGGKTAPFLTYERFLELMKEYPDVSANIEIKGTIQAKLMAEPQNPSLIDLLIETTPRDLQERIIWSSFATSNIVKMKERIPEAQIAQLFAELERLKSHKGEDLVYPAPAVDRYRQFAVKNVEELMKQGIKAAHPCIVSLMSEEGAATAKFCAENGIAIRTWALGEKNPSKNAEAKKLIMNVLNIKEQYPNLKIDIITDYAPDVQGIIRDAVLKQPLIPGNGKKDVSQLNI